jgi:hypothetical protein
MASWFLGLAEPAAVVVERDGAADFCASSAIGSIDVTAAVDVGVAPLLIQSWVLMCASRARRGSCGHRR